jgi:hypothetical protein
MRTKVLTLCLVLLMTLLPLALIGGVAQPGLPELTVTVEDVPEVESDPVEYVHVKTTATVTLSSFPLGATVTVNATAETWVVEVDPTTFEVPSGQTSPHEETIDLDIRVPPRASAEKSVELRVFANTTTTIGIEYSDEAITDINVKQFYGLRLSSNGTMSLEQGKNLTARMRITNTGNGIDNYTIALNNGATLGTKGLTVTYDESVHEVGRDRTVPVVVQVVAADDADLGNVEALFTVRSAGDSTKTDTWKLSINVKEGDNGNGNGNGGNGGDGDEDTGRGFYIGIGIVVVVLVLFIIGWVFVSRAQEEEAEDEAYVVGRERDDEDR